MADSTAHPRQGSPVSGATREAVFSGSPVDLGAAAKLSVRDLLAAYALVRGQKVALPHLALLRGAFPALFRQRPGWRRGTWDAADDACLEAIRTLLRERGRLHLVASLDDACEPAATDESSPA